MSEISDKTVSFWTENYRNTVAGTRRSLNFWDAPIAYQEQRKIGLIDRRTPDQLATIQLLAERVRPGVLRSGISIGCGSGHKELEVAKSGLVTHFTLVEVVPELLNAARAAFGSAGLADQTTFILGDFRQHVIGKAFDLVYFDNSLHHMQNVESLLAECVGLISPGGFFLMDDFVGPTYNQFSEDLYSYAEYVRGLLPTSCFEGDEAPLRALGRIPVQAYLDADPSEACDSGAILPAIAKLMPAAEIIPTGGLIYYLACREIFGELVGVPDRDNAIIRLLFELDRVLVRANPEITCYALAIWQKLSDSAMPTGDWKRLIRWPTEDIPVPGQP